MKTKLKFIPGLLLLFGVVLFTGCNDDEDAPQVDEKNIVEVAVDAGSFSILIEAAQKAGLAEFLSTENNLTVFAPTDDAFAALLSDLGLSSLDDIPTADLASILTYHVIGTKAMSSDLSTGYVSTLSSYDNNNITMYIETESGVMINNSVLVTTADIEASNGVIHVVDKVILPPTVVNIALANENFTTLVQAVVKAGLVDALSSEGPFTVFAPTNDAFDALFAQLGVSGINDLTAEQLTPILLYHVVPGNVVSTELTSGEVGTLNADKNLTVDLSSGVKINESSVVAADIQGANGVVHVIDKVLIP
ncbi:Uncaracterized surface protein containing fasciclin (FAS1) repeats [Tangfeifania diversioriginum]|uniref:Uncaracterized surface protein containing fasciclin (FAS1) repeats n=1 Tax=Tangfeifania diversioriginum TaxID=1168035 RepID=A0A1M6F6U5_9BACT|nr:fasciclin domain-containing protein [Tangfeifania diversioriginum]SHI93309.1 Uncaracterized surface protein containing fasciclin (FAS1) repeats [Tangfeifania diversioriginum]